jgi:DNA mismatch repair ATPase MutL
MPLAPLPPKTVKLIGSSQVITSVSSVIKELMENSIDAGAQHIEIKLVSKIFLSFSFDSLEQFPTLKRLLYIQLPR